MILSIELNQFSRSNFWIFPPIGFGVKSENKQLIHQTVLHQSESFDWAFDEKIRPAFTETWVWKEKVFHEFPNYSHFDARNKMNDSSLKSIRFDWSRDGRNQASKSGQTILKLDVSKYGIIINTLLWNVRAIRVVIQRTNWHIFNWKVRRKMKAFD